MENQEITIKSLIAKVDAALSTSELSRLQRDLHRARFGAQPSEALELENNETDEQSLNFSQARADVSRDEEPLPDDRSIFSLSNKLALAVTNILAKKEASNFMEAQALYFQRNPNFARAYLDSNLTKDLI